jgi:hypothetical protein
MRPAASYTTPWDTIAHAHYVEKLPPLAMAARAQIALSTIGSRPPINCVNLLG